MHQDIMHGGLTFPLPTGSWATEAFFFSSFFSTLGAAALTFSTFLSADLDDDLAILNRVFLGGVLGFVEEKRRGERWGGGKVTTTLYV